MAKNELIFITKDGRNTVESISASGGPVDIFVAGADGSKVLGIGAPTVSGTVTLIDLLYDDGINPPALLNRKSTPAAGDDLFDMLFLAKDANGNKYLNMPSGSKITCDPQGTGSATVFVQAEDY